MDDLLKQIEKERLEKSDKKSYNKSTGAVYGAWNDDNDKYGEIRKKHADMYYEAVRKRDKEREISKVARNSKFSKSDILEIYNHVFIKKHHLEDGYRRFDPDYDMAESWKRLRNGENIQEHDIILLQHELYELNLMKQQGLSYNEAHNRTNEKFNYQKALIKWKIKKG